jgi:Kdo2-lipid IVA lauroyltransferase/acyltransferase
MSEPGSAVLSEAQGPGPSTAPRWHAHSFDRAPLYRLTEALGWMPRGGRLALARQVGRLAQRVLRRERTAARDMLAVVTGATGPRLETLVTRLFGDFAMCFSDLVTTNRLPMQRLVDIVSSVVGADHVQGLTGGVVSVTAHVGNWELAGRLLATHGARPTHVVVTADDAPALRRWVRRDGEGVRFVPRAHPAIGVQLVRALRRGDVVALQGDRAIGTRGDLPIPFFGRPAPFPIGPFVLARAAQVPVVPAFCLLGADGRYTIRVAPPIAVERGREEEAARTWAAALEQVVREHPTQWFNFFDVWRPFAG